MGVRRTVPFSRRKCRPYCCCDIFDAQRQIFRFAPILLRTRSSRQKYVVVAGAEHRCEPPDKYRGKVTSSETPPGLRKASATGHPTFSSEAVDRMPCRTSLRSMSPEESARSPRRRSRWPVVRCRTVSA
jgi:hypothetical protein